MHTFPEPVHTLFAPFAHYLSCYRMPCPARSAAYSTSPAWWKHLRMCFYFSASRPVLGPAAYGGSMHWLMKSVAAMYTRDPSPRWRPAGAGRDQALVQAPSVKVAESARRAAGALLLSYVSLGGGPCRQ